MQAEKLVKTCQGKVFDSDDDVTVIVARITYDEGQSAIHLNIYITPPLFQNSATHRDLRCGLQPSTHKCNTRLEFRVHILTPFLTPLCLN